MKISEIFTSIQGEGKYAGYPALFIRTSGCNNTCDFCDTLHHTIGKEILDEKIIALIKKSKQNIIIWTGGEPTIQIEDIKYIISKTKNFIHHLETNGKNLEKNMKYFDYISVSPKDKITLKKILKLKNKNMDIKIPTDLVINKDLIKYADILTPLETKEIKKNIKTRKKVWIYCIKNNIRFSPRLHTYVWKDKRGK